MAQLRRNPTRRIVQSRRLVRPLFKPNKHEVLAQTWHFIHYIEDIAATPKGLRGMLDISVVQKKCDQLKKIIRDAE